MNETRDCHIGCSEHLAKGETNTFTRHTPELNKNWVWRCTKCNVQIDASDVQENQGLMLSPCPIEPAPSRYFAFRDPAYTGYFDDAVEALDKTNWASFKEDAEEAGAVTLFEGYQSDLCWGCWHWEPGNTAAEELFERLGSALADYPVLDEAAYSELEHDAWWTYWSDMGLTDFCATRLELSNGEWSDVEDLLGQDLLDDLSERIVEGMNYHDGFECSFDVHGAGEAFDLWVEDMTALRTFAGTQGVDA